MMSKRLTFVALFSAVSCGAADAHAVIVNATPSPGQQVSGTEIAIEIRFNSRIDATRSNLKLTTPEGASVSLPLSGDAAADRLKAQARGLAPGAYRLHWQTLSPDGHITQGDIPFSVGR